MDTELAKHWNESSKRIPPDKDKSPYAVGKETLFPRNANVCDLGGGMGADALYFLTKGHRVILLDISDYALVTAQKAVERSVLSDRLQTQQVDLSQGKIPQPDGNFDVVFSRLALHYFRRETLVSLYREVYRILKPGGVAFVSIKSVNDEKEMIFLRRTSREVEPGIFEEDGILKVRFSQEQLKDLLIEAGITDFDISEYKERFEGRKDIVKSGNEELLLADITIRK